MISPDNFSSSANAEMLFRLDGTVCLVTGGAGHLGAALATTLAEAGGHVVIVGPARSAPSGLAQHLARHGLSAEAVAADITRADEIQSLVADLAKRHGKLDVLVNNLDQGRPGVMANSGARDYEVAIGNIVAAPAQLVSAAHDLLREAAQARGDSSVVNIASIYGMVSPDPRVFGQSGMNISPHYCVAQAALLQYTRNAAIHLAHEGIRVNAVSPGALATETIFADDAEFAQAMTKKVLLGRLGRAEDIAGAVLFLASPASRFITGANLPVDGGLTAS